MLLVIDDGLHIYGRNNNWRNLFFFRWDQYIFSIVNNNLKFAPANLHSVMTKLLVMKV